jgi:two-component system cell cycle response regulator DivK
MGKKVLAVDDSKTLRMIVARNLRPFGVEIVEAENGSVGLSKAQAEKPDLILLDFNMPVLDGYQTLEALKKDNATKNIPVIMLTTETVKETVVKLIKLGLRDFIAKPFSREALLQKVNPVLALYEGAEVPTEAQVEGALHLKALETQGKKTILAVDDKENVLKLLKEFLCEHYNVLTAASGQAAVAMIPSTPMDLLFLDIDMPDLSGIEVFKQMKCSLEAKRAKVVGMVLRTAQSEIATAKQAGIKDFLYKPFTKTDVLSLFTAPGGDFAAGDAEGGRKWFVPSEKDVRILAFPEEHDLGLKTFANALGTEVRTELNDLADEGVNRLIIKLTPAVLADFAMVKKFLALLELINGLALTVKLVAENDTTRDRLQQFSETAKMQTFNSLDQALESFS